MSPVKTSRFHHKQEKPKTCLMAEKERYLSTHCGFRCFMFLLLLHKKILHLKKRGLD